MWCGVGVVCCVVVVWCGGRSTVRRVRAKAGEGRSTSSYGTARGYPKQLSPLSHPPAQKDYREQSVELKLAFDVVFCMM